MSRASFVLRRRVPRPCQDEGRQGATDHIGADQKRAKYKVLKMDHEQMHTEKREWLFVVYKVVLLALFSCLLTMHNVGPDNEQ
jgi:hypothetical protein